jgi:hypothetical protein
MRVAFLILPEILDPAEAEGPFLLLMVERPIWIVNAFVEQPAGEGDEGLRSRVAA